MLSGGPFNAYYTVYKSIYFSFRDNLSVLFEIVFNISVSDLVLNLCKRSRSKHIALTEKFFDKFMCHTLIFTRKVKVDIRLFVSIKSQKCFKRNIKSVFFKRLSAHRTHFVRHIDSDIVFTVCKELAVLAFFANIMRRKRIYFCDIAHRCGKTRAYGTTAPDKITVGIRLLNELLCDNIHDGVTVSDNRMEFFFESFIDNFRKRISINFLCIFDTCISKFIFRAFDNRRKFFSWYRSHSFNFVE